MSSSLSPKGRAFLLFLMLPAIMIPVNCGPPGAQQNANTANGNSSGGATGPGQRAGTPADAKPMGQQAPGFYQAGPAGPVSLRFTQPQDGQTIEGTSVAPTFEVSGYPIYQDQQRNKGQHIHVILDNLPYEADYTPETPFSPPNGIFNNLKPGVHTLRAFLGREWHESIKEPGGAGFDMVVFFVGPGQNRPQVDQNAPLLTYSRPKGEYRWKEDPRGVLLDFYVTNANLGINDYKVKYTLDNRPPQILTRWEPVWWKWEELMPGEHRVTIELLDKDNKPVPFMVGPTNYNRTERTFRILREGEQPSSAAGNANSRPANGNANSRAANGNANR